MVSRVTDSPTPIGPPCVDCGTVASREILQKHGDGPRYEVSVRRCLSCGLTFQAEWQENCSQDIYEYFQSDDWQARYQAINPINAKRYRDLLRNFSGRTSGRRLLDVGAGTGWFVQVAQECGWESEGIDFAEGSVAYCQRFGRNVRRADLYDIDERYDVCTLFEVIEHVPQPTAFLTQAAKLVRPGGLLYLTTPNFSALDRRIVGAEWEAIHNEHLSYFTPARLQRAIDASGLEIVRLTTQNLSVAEIKRAVFSWLGVSRPGPGENIDVALRERIEASNALGALKGLANFLLNATGLGNAMGVLCLKPSRA